MDDYHQNLQDPPEFRMETVKKCRGNLQRLLTESQKIGSTDEDRLMNSKMEYGRNKLVRYQPTVDRV